jgi:ankyrin repeat protein
LSSEGLDRIIVVSLPAMGTWEQIIETLSNAFELSSSSTIDRIELLDNDDAPVAMNIVSSSKFWKACLELYQESDTYFNLYVVTVPHHKQRHNSHSAGGSTQTSSAASSSYSSYKTSAPAPLSPAPVPPPVTGGATLSPGGARQANDIANFLAACGDGDLEAVSDYLQRGYDVNLKDDSNLTGLHIACIHGHQKIVQFLVDKEASITCRDLDGMTPLHFACENNHTAVAIYLVRMGGDTSLRNRAGLTSLHYICLCGNMQLTVLIRDYLINVATGTGLTLLHCAADQGHYDLMNYLIEHSAQISPRDDEGLTPLHLSVINGHLHCVKLLIEHGAYWNVRDDTGMSPLLHACHEGNMEMVEYLLHPQVGGNVLARNDNGDTALHLATSAGSLDLVKFLLTRKVEINARNKSGETALGVAMQAGFDHLVSWLRDRGATNKAESREEASTREKVDNKTETAARAFEAEEMLNLQRELEAAAKRR